jgi:uncharacterized protein YjcR
MERAPNEKANEAYKLYKKGLKLVEIANRLDVPDIIVRRWKKNYECDNECSEKISERSRKKGAPIGNKNATGAPGNKNAEKFGFFSKHLPKETLDLMKEIFVKL